MARASWHTQSALRNRVNVLAGQTTAPRKRRRFIDSAGNYFTTGASASTLERFVQYGVRRHETVARLCALFQETRELEQLDKRSSPVQVRASGAVWQAFRGTHTMPACHSCPSHLQLNGHLPTLITKSMAIRRHMIFEFADCMLMPAAVNAVDGVLDSEIGRETFAAAASLLLNERGATWNEGLEFYKEGLRGAIGDAADSFTSPLPSTFKGETEQQQNQVEVVGAYYEGLFLHSTNAFGVEHYRKQVSLEARRLT